MDTEGIIQIGIIINTHGVRGELKFISQTDDPELLFGLEELIIANGDQRLRYPIVKIRETQKHWLLKLEGIDSMEKAAQLKGQGIFTEESSVKPLAEDEFFIHDLIDAKVYSTDNQFLGTIKNYFEVGAQGVCEVQADDGDFLFPTSAEVLQEVVPSQKVVIQLIPELIDLNKKTKS